MSDHAVMEGSALYINPPPTWRYIWSIVKERLRWMWRHKRWFPKAHRVVSSTATTITIAEGPKP